LLDKYVTRIGEAIREVEARAGVPQRLALMARLTEIAVLLVDCLEGLVREVAGG